MADAPLLLGFTAGMVASVNPCGFAMLPAYLSYFLGAEAADQPPGTGLLRALLVGVVVSAGFMAVFAVLGLVVATTAISVYEIAPWLTVVVGAGLVGLGVALTAGWEMTVRFAGVDRGGRDRRLRQMFLFGISYAVASCGCTLPVFLAMVAGTFRRSTVAGGVAVFVAYGLGMALVLMAVTVAIAAARQGLIRRLRRLLPLVSRAAGVLLIVTGAYVAWYGIVELGGHTGRADGVTGLVIGWSTTIQAWIDRFGTTRLALLLAIFLLSTAFVALLRVAFSEADQGPFERPRSGPRRAPDITAPAQRGAAAPSTKPTGRISAPQRPRAAKPTPSQNWPFDHPHHLDKEQEMTDENRSAGGTADSPTRSAAPRAGRP